MRGSGTKEGEGGGLRTAPSWAALSFCIYSEGGVLGSLVGRLRTMVSVRYCTAGWSQAEG